MKKSISKNYVYNVIYEAFILIIPFAITPYVSRVLGADGIGTCSFVSSIVSYFSLFAVMGVTTYGQREISFFQNDREKRSEIFWNTKVFQIIISGVTLLIYVIFCFFQKNISLYLVYSFNILSVTFDVTWLFKGMEEFGCIVLRNILIKVLNFCFIFVFVKKPTDIVLYGFGMSFFEFISNFSLWLYLPKIVNKPHKSNLKPFTNYKIIISLFIPTIAIQIYTVLDKTMIGIITKDSFENGYYEQAIKLSKMALTFVTALGSVLIPRIGFLFNNGEVEKVKTYIYRGYYFVWFLGIPLCFGLIGISDNFVPWFYGDGFDKVSTLLKVLSFLILSIGINNVTGMQYLIPSKRENFFTISVLIGAVTNFVLNLFLIYYFKSIGAAIASVVAETTIAIIQLVYVRREISMKKVFFPAFKYLISGCIMLVAIRILNSFLLPSMLHTFLLICAGASVYFFILLALRDSFLRSILSKIKKFL